MDEKIKPVVDAIQSRCKTTLHEFRGEVTLVIAPECLIEMCTYLAGRVRFRYAGERNGSRLLAGTRTAVSYCLSLLLAFPKCHSMHPGSIKWQLTGDSYH